MATRSFLKCHHWKSIGFFLYTREICYWSFDLDIRSQTKIKSLETEKSNMAARQPFWKWNLWQSTDFGPWPQTTYKYKIQNWNNKANLSYILETMPESRYRIMQCGHQATILKVTLLKINRLLPMHTSNVPVKFGFDIQNQTKFRVRKLKKSNMAARQPLWK